jgi:hypothetical protein
VTTTYVSEQGQNPREIPSPESLAVVIAGHFHGCVIFHHMNIPYLIHLCIIWLSPVWDY